MQDVYRKESWNYLSKSDCNSYSTWHIALNSFNFKRHQHLWQFKEKTKENMIWQMLFCFELDLQISTYLISRKSCGWTLNNDQSSCCVSTRVGLTEFGESEKGTERDNLLLLPPRNQNPNPTVATMIASTSLKQWSQNPHKVDSCSYK